MQRVKLFGRRTAAVEDDYFFPVACHCCLRLGWFICFVIALVVVDDNFSRG